MEKLKNLNETRVILFRGKRDDNGEWVEGSLLQGTKSFYCENCKCLIYEECDIIVKHSGLLAMNSDYCWECSIPYDPRNSFEIIPKTVGQYTGLTDKNGKKIFEGDIVNRYWNNEIFVPMPSIIRYEVKKALWVFESIWIDWETKKYMRDKRELEYLYGIDTLSPYADEDVRCDLLEVVGNIYDNPIVEYDEMRLMKNEKE